MKLHTLVVVFSLAAGAHGFSRPILSSRVRRAPPATMVVVPSPLVALPAPLVLCRAASVALGAGNLAQYHLRLSRLEKEGQPTWRAVQAATRASWVTYVRANAGLQGYTYAIQTLRNAITACVALTGTMLTAFTVTMTYLRTVKAELEWLVLLQFSSTGLLLLFSSYFFLQSARAMTHAGFMFPVAADPDAGEVPPTKISPEALAAGGWRPNAIYALRPRSIEVTMAKSETAQWAGLRFLYLAITGVVWICGGEIAFFVATLAMRRFLAGIDRPPELAEIEATAI